MVAFAPGELSTVLAPDQPAEVAGSVVGTRYNFADLPCPPMSIMVGSSLSERLNEYLL